MELEADRYQVRVAGSESVRLHGARTQPAGNGSPAGRRRAEPFVEAGITRRQLPLLDCRLPGTVLERIHPAAIN